MAEVKNERFSFSLHLCSLLLPFILSLSVVILCPVPSSPVCVSTYILTFGSSNYLSFFFFAPLVISYICVCRCSRMYFRRSMGGYFLSKCQDVAEKKINVGKRRMPTALRLRISINTWLEVEKKKTQNNRPNKMEKEIHSFFFFCHYF